jgi:hypothetical protein
LVCFAPRPIRAVKLKDLADQIRGDAIVRQLHRGEKESKSRKGYEADLHHNVQVQDDPPAFWISLTTSSAATY